MIVERNVLKDTLSNLFQNRCSKLTSKTDIKKFRSVWAMVDALNSQQSLRVFLCREGDCKNIPYLFASIFFNCHTKESEEYINKLFNNNKNLQGRDKKQFAFDLIIGWIFELIIFKNFGLQKSGCDYDYMLEKGKSINSGADFILGNISIELAVDNLGLSLDRNVFHLRYEKWDRILEEEMFLFILCPNHLKYYLYHAHHYSDRLNIKKVDEIKAFSKYRKVGGTEFTGWDKLDAFDLNQKNLENSFDYISSGII